MTVVVKARRNLAAAILRPVEEAPMSLLLKRREF